MRVHVVVLVTAIPAGRERERQRSEKGKQRVNQSKNLERDKLEEKLVREREIY